MKAEIINLLQTTQASDGGNQGINARDVHRLLKVGRLITLAERECHIHKQKCLCFLQE